MSGAPDAPSAAPGTGLGAVEARITAACARSGRDPSEVRLVCVTKGRSVDEIRAAGLVTEGGSGGGSGRGARELGESRVQEWRAKADELPSVRWHVVGHLQRNKAKYLDERIARIHSLDSARLADELERQGERKGIVWRCLIEVNVAFEASKYGVAPAEAAALLTHARGLERVAVDGVMGMAPNTGDPGDARAAFRRLRELRDTLGLAELSMGMSGDYEIAVEEGATFVRVGSALFAPPARPGPEAGPDERGDPPA